MANKVPVKTVKELEAMHTGTLMSRRKALLKCEECFSHSVRSYDGEKEPSPDNSGFIEFKDTPAWQQAYSDIKKILATRENIPSKAERKAMRQAKAKAGK